MIRKTTMWLIFTAILLLVAVGCRQKPVQHQIAEYWLTGRNGDCWAGYGTVIAVTEAAGDLYTGRVAEEGQRGDDPRNERRFCVKGAWIEITRQDLNTLTYRFEMGKPLRALRRKMFNPRLERLQPVQPTEVTFTIADVYRQFGTRPSVEVMSVREATPQCLFLPGKAVLLAEGRTERLYRYVFPERAENACFPGELFFLPRVEPNPEFWLLGPKPPKPK